TGDEFRDVVFADVDTGWATSLRPVNYDWQGRADNWEAAVWHTDEGGEAWAQETVPEGASILHAVDFVDTQIGCAVGVRYIGDDQYGYPEHRPVVYRTEDGGQTWYERYSPDLEIFLSSVDLVDAEHGWATGGLGEVIHTADGGTTWITQTLTCGYPSCPWRLHALEMLDNQEGWIAGEGPYHTTDGGAHWNVEDLDVGGDFQDIQFVDALNGWLAGNYGMILVTRDGGDTRRWVDNDVSSFTLRGISFVNADKGWLVGDCGTILTTIQEPFWPVYLPLVTRVG
ncbi:MAG: YCF48-related protein, partial [Anaerolineae bacterium]